MQFIKLDLSNAIASIKLQHAGGNRINFQMREEIFNAVESVAKSDARVLVIKGDGEDFCLGGDVRDWPDVPVDKLRPRVEVFANALDRLEQLDIPTIASVQGGCAGGGFELALACDMIIASRSALGGSAFLSIWPLMTRKIHFASERSGRAFKRWDGPRTVTLGSKFTGTLATRTASALPRRSWSGSCRR